MLFHLVFASSSPTMTIFVLCFLLLCGHALGDFGLQSDWVAAHKHPRYPEWRWVMAAHCLIHAGIVALITGSVWLGVSELFAHWALDVAKCDGDMSFNQDQLGHVLCKVVWAVLVVA